MAWWEKYVEDAARTVHEAEDSGKPKPTGVLDRNGMMIHRKPEPIGFRHPLMAPPASSSIRKP